MLLKAEARGGKREQRGGYFGGVTDKVG